MPWEQRSPGVYACPVGIIGTYFAKVCTPDATTGHEHCSVEVDATVQFDPPLAAQDARSRLRSAWLVLRHEQPGLATTLEDDRSTRVYRVPDETALAEWLDQTLSVVAGPATADGVFAAFKSSPLPRLHYLEAAQQLVLQLSHWRTDAAGAQLLLGRLLELLVRPADAAAAALRWGAEVDNLTLPLEDALHAADAADERAQAYLFKDIKDVMAAMPPVGVRYKGDGATPAGATHREALVFSRTATQAAHAAAERRGVDFTTAILAATVQATYEHAQPAKRDRGYASIFSHHLRPHLPPPLDGPALAADVAVAGHFVVRPRDAPRDFDALVADLARQVAAFDPAEHVRALRVYAAKVLPMSTAPPPPGADPPSDVMVTGLGPLERYVRREYAGDDGQALTVEDVRLGIETTTRVPQLQDSRWRNRQRLSVSYNAAYQDAAFVRRLLRRVVEHLERGLGVEIDAVAA